MTSREANSVPKVLWQYFGIIEMMREHALKGISLYTLDKMRAEFHDELCKYYRLDKETTETITDNLDRYDDAVEIHFAIKGLQKETQAYKALKE